MVKTLTLIDLDDILINGNSLCTHRLKFKDDSIQLGGLSYLMEVIALEYKNSGAIIVYAVNPYNGDISTDNIICCRSDLLRTQYEIAVDKLGSLGIPVVIVGTKEALIKKITDMVQCSRKFTSKVNIYSGYKKEFCKYISAYVNLISDGLYTTQNLKALTNGVDIPYGASLACAAVMPLFLDENGSIPELGKTDLYNLLEEFDVYVKTIRQELLLQGKLVDTYRLMENLNVIVNFFNTIKERYTPRQQEGAIKVLSEFILEYNNREKTEDYTKCILNAQASSIFLKALQMKSIAEFLGADLSSVYLSSHEREYYNNKFSKLIARECADENQIVSEPLYPSKETLTLIDTQTGKVIGVETGMPQNTNIFKSEIDSKESVEEEVNEFLIDFRR